MAVLPSYTARRTGTDMSTGRVEQVLSPHCCVGDQTGRRHRHPHSGGRMQSAFTTSSSQLALKPHLCDLGSRLPLPTRHSVTFLITPPHHSGCRSGTRDVLPEMAACRVVGFSDFVDKITHIQYLNLAFLNGWAFLSSHQQT